MARSGITQAQVNEAADALLRGGERPTIERVRQALGTGSPNTLVRLLEGWWSDLGRRLDAQAAKIALPDAPEPVVAAASQLWLVAVEHAQGWAKMAIADDVAHAAAQLFHQHRVELGHSLNFRMRLRGIRPGSASGA